MYQVQTEEHHEMIQSDQRPVNEAALASFLRTVEPMMIAALKKAAQSHAFDGIAYLVTVCCLVLVMFHSFFTAFHCCGLYKLKCFWVQNWTLSR